MKNISTLLLLMQFLASTLQKPTETMVDYIKDLKLVDHNKIFVKNREACNEKIQKFILGGYQHLAVISDFDKTISKQHVDGKPQLHSFGIMLKCPSVPAAEISKIVANVANKYSPIDKDLNISKSERDVLKSDWWIKTMEAYKGLKISPEEIFNTTLEFGPPARDNAKLFFKTLVDADVPVLLLSAGVGEFLEPLLKQMNIDSPNIEMLTNYLKLDSEGRIIGCNRSHAIHTDNKNRVSFDETKFIKKIGSRHNILVLGDHLNDSTMADSLENVENVLKIGFFYGEAESVVPVWLDTFDIVLRDDQTMDVPNAILNLLD